MRTSPCADAQDEDRAGPVLQRGAPAPPRIVEVLARGARAAGGGGDETAGRRVGRGAGRVKRPDDVELGLARRDGAVGERGRVGPVGADDARLR